MIAVRNQNVGPEFVLASLVATYPDAAFAENVRTLIEDDRLGQGLGETAARSLAALRETLVGVLADSAKLDDLRSDFIDCFDRGKAVTSLYETEYGRERSLVKGNELADISGFYRAFGFETGGEGVQPEMVDHVAVELEFYALLCFKSEALESAGEQEGVEVVLDARRKFLKDHLGRFLGALCDRPGLAESPFYSIVFGFCRELVADECRKLEVTPDPVQWLSGKKCRQRWRVAGPWDV